MDQVRLALKHSGRCELWYDHDVRPHIVSRRGTVCLIRRACFSCLAESILECHVWKKCGLFAKAAEIWGRIPGTKKQLMVDTLESQAAALVAHVEETLPPEAVSCPGRI